MNEMLGLGNPSENPGALSDVATVFVERESEGHSGISIETNKRRMCTFQSKTHITEGGS